MEWVKAIIPEGEWEWIRQSLQRGRLTGTATHESELEFMEMTHELEKIYGED